MSREPTVSRFPCTRCGIGFYFVHPQPAGWVCVYCKERDERADMHAKFTAAMDERGAYEHEMDQRGDAA